MMKNMQNKQRIYKSLKHTTSPQQMIQQSYSIDSKSLSFNCNKISDENIKYICNQDWMFDMRQLWLWSDQIGNSLLNTLVITPWPNLTKISLNDNCITASGIKYIIKNKWDNLIQIDLSMNKIGNQGVKTLMKHKWPKLEFISLNKCFIRSQGVKIFMSQCHASQAQTVFLNFNKIQPIGVNFIMIGSCKSASLKSIVIRYNLINSSFWKGCKQFLPVGWNIY